MLDNIFMIVLFAGILIPIGARVFLNMQITNLEMVIHMVVAIGVVFAGWHIGRFANLSDQEVWNGTLVRHERINDSHMESYQCRCRTVSSGSGNNRTSRTVCDTCWRRRYTVDWYFYNDFGGSSLDRMSVGHRDSLSQSIHRTNDPTHFINAINGMPVSQENRYTNYVLGANRSLFSIYDGYVEQFEEILPDYPRVYNYTQIDRVVSSGFENLNQSFIQELDQNLDECLQTIGPEQQANIVVVIANTDNSSYTNALESHWNGGKKNDVIIVIGAPEYPQIDWVDTITFAGNFNNTLLTDELSLAINEIGTLDDAALMTDAIQQNVREHFERVPMEEFEYLKESVRPSTTAVIILTIISIIISLGLTVLFHRYDLSLETFTNRSHRRYY